MVRKMLTMMALRRQDAIRRQDFAPTSPFLDFSRLRTCTDCPWNHRMHVIKYWENRPKNLQRLRRLAKREHFFEPARLLSTELLSRMKARQKCPSKIWRAHLSEIGLLLASLKQKPPGWAVARIRLKVCLGIFSNKKRTKINNDNLA